MSEGLVLLKRTFDPLEAQLVKNLLEEKGIGAFVMDTQTNALNLGPAIGGVRIMVLKEDLTAAKRLLDNANIDYEDR